MKAYNRCEWCGTDPLYQAYHDNEWGKPSDDDRHLFAMLCLEGMQAGLSWITILKKRERYYQVFADFDPAIIAQFDDAMVDSLMTDAGIIRHRGKIKAIINNAKCYLKITETQAFSDYLGTCRPAAWQKYRRIITQKPLLISPATLNVQIRCQNSLKKTGLNLWARRFAMLLCKQSAW